MKLNESLSKVRGDLERQTKTNRELKDKLNNKETTIACLTEKKRHWENEYQTLKECKGSDEGLSEKRIEKDIMKTEVENLKQEITRLEGQKKDDEDNKRDELRQLNYLVNTAQNNVSELQRHIKYREQKEGILSKEIEILKKDRNSMADELRKVQLEKNDLTDENRSARNHIIELEQKLNFRSDDVMHMCKHLVFNSRRNAMTHKGSIQDAEVTRNADSMSRLAG